MKTGTRILLIVLVILSSGQNIWLGKKTISGTDSNLKTGWKILSPQGSFSVHLPSDMIEEHSFGAESFLGSYSNNKIWLAFDYGTYSKDIHFYSNEPEYDNKILNINGKKARISFTHNEYTASDYKFTGAIHLPVSDVPGKKLTAYAQFDNEQDRATVIAIFNTITFH